MKTLITLFALLSLTLLAAAQPPDTLWTRTFGGGIYDQGYSVQQTSDGGYVIAGTTWSFGAGGVSDIYLIKTDANGDSVWTRTFGGSSADYGYSVQQTSNGGFVIVGKTVSYGAGYLDVYLIKTDANGDSVWTRTFGGSGTDVGISVQVISDGGYIIGGTTDSDGAGVEDIYLIKTDANGDSVWTRTFGGSGMDVGHSVHQTSDGGYIIAGLTYSFGAGNADVYLIKTDAAGNQVWTRTFGGSGMDVGSCVQQTSDGGYIIVGYTDSYGLDIQIYLIKTDAAGNLVWQRIYGGSNADVGACMQQTSDGGYVIAGHTSSYGLDIQIYLIMADSAGNLIWQCTFGGGGMDVGSSVQQTLDDGYVIAGTTWSYGAGYSDIYLIKTDAGGTPVKSWGEPPSPLSRFALMGAFPNPFNPTTTFRFTLPQAAQVTLDVFDINGRVVGAHGMRPSSGGGGSAGASLVPLQAGSHEITFDGSGLPSGVYLYRLTMSGSGASPAMLCGKMVLLK
ncbi:MAG: hypothetical protein NTW14_12945 [bacterium]|nr:hypothetical protein [bacterium]